MEPSNLLYICLTAFASVFVLLALLAALMQLIIAVFPKVTETFSSKHIAVISSTYQTLIPGSKVTRIEEIK